jgi:cytochrome c oxidase assembly protein subunit 15
MIAPTAAVDLAPAAQVMLLGALLASAVLGWVWLRRREQHGRSWQHRLAVLTLVLTFDLVVFGAFTRLTDSGLGCPDWPGCYGHASPVGAVTAIGVAQSAMPSGPVTHGKAWIEMLHRYLATGVGTLILVLAASSWLDRGGHRSGKRRTPQEHWWPTFTLLWVCLQGAFGAWTVTMKLQPAIVTLHLLGGLVLLALLCVQVEQHARRQDGAHLVVLDFATARLLRVACVLLTVQLALGGWVSTNYAVLACADFPRCQGSWWPEMRFDQAFQIWRELGMTRSGEPITFAALTAIHLTHRVVALVVLLVLGGLALRLRALPVLGRWIAALAVLQLVSGVANVVLGWPLVAALMHTGGAAGLVMVLAVTVARTTVPNPGGRASAIGVPGVSA